MWGMAINRSVGEIKATEGSSVNDTFNPSIIDCQVNNTILRYLIIVMLAMPGVVFLCLRKYLPSTVVMLKFALMEFEGWSKASRQDITVYWEY